MDKYLTSYIDNQIIREFAERTRDGYSLDIVDLDDHEKSNLIDCLLKHDSTLKDLILDHAQCLINERIPLVESRDNYSNGLFPNHDKQTGEVNWLPKVGGF